MTTSTVIHSARTIDADGEVDDFWVAFEGDSIAATGTGIGWEQLGIADVADVVDAGGNCLAPGFIDLHGHGAGGFSFDDGAAAIASALATHRAHGTTRSVVSLVAGPVETLAASLSQIADLAESDPLVLGAHLEGPFLAPSRRGAHNPEFLIDPSPAVIDRLLDAARGHLRQVTIAPELPNALEAIEILVEAGVIVAVGHTDATEAQTQDAFHAGARLLTHAFNAMPGIGHRAPGPVVAALQDDRVTLELVLDGVHVHPHVARLLFDAAPGRVALVTDSMAAAGTSDGRYALGSLEVVVSDGRALLANADGTTGAIAGSTLTLDRALRIATTSARQSVPVAVAALTATPARVLGLEHRLGRLAPGYAADAVLLTGECDVLAVWAAGARLR
ncbi:N-acetylglucosamine-6-phosphate deacetylase [Gryllotalpicola sp.]|uniref:N-acetylglucosamine-6-phosphate deacetylase n=1 Tax=Gryllotalpicola sp. TaxID=1932787 RepID=UPI0026364F71|nr:N-acetylglucosamine-6-phosphate deacetylase [Gryllotalpicola sp.]